MLLVCIRISHKGKHLRLVNWLACEYQTRNTMEEMPHFTNADDNKKNTLQPITVTYYLQDI